METEYEIQIRDNRISETSIQVMRALEDDYRVLQVEQQVDKILAENVSIYNKNISLLKLLTPVRDALVKNMMMSVSKIQRKIMSKMRIKNNKMCSIKCETDSIIHNFTQCEIPTELSSFLASGLNNVPDILVDSAQVLNETEAEVKIACRNLFKSIVGVFPYSILLKDSLDTVIKNLMILAPNNQGLMDSLIALRENHATRWPKFIRSLKKIRC